MTDNFEKKVAVDGPVVNAGELGSSTFSPGQALPAGPLGLGQRWTVARKREVVLRLLRDEPVQLLSRQLTSGQHAEQPPAKRRGPKPAISDQALLVAIEADLEASPWEGEGYRKVWARLRVCRDIRVARKRVLRLMRENNLLSPHRCRRRGGNPHDGEIITHAPNLMWGTDGVRVFTVDDGWGWIFTAVEHWNAECVGCARRASDRVCSGSGLEATPHAAPCAIPSDGSCTAPRGEAAGPPRRAACSSLPPPESAVDTAR